MRNHRDDDEEEEEPQRRRGGTDTGFLNQNINLSQCDSLVQTGWHSARARGVHVHCGVGSTSSAHCGVHVACTWPWTPHPSSVMCFLTPAAGWRLFKDGPGVLEVSREPRCED